MAVPTTSIAVGVFCNETPLHGQPQDSEGMGDPVMKGRHILHSLLMMTPLGVHAQLPSLRRSFSRPLPIPEYLWCGVNVVPALFRF